MEIRKFVPSDYDVTAEILSRAYGGYSFDADAIRDMDENLDGQFIAKRWIAWQGRTPVGVCEYRHTPEMFDPGEFLLAVAVYPEYQGQLIGKQLYDFLQEDISAHNPIKYRTSCREDNCRSVKFLQDRGFVRGMHILELELDLASVAAENKSFASPAVSAEGIEIASLSELSDDKERDRKLFSLIMALRKVTLGKDVELPQPPSAESYEYFQSSFEAARSHESSFVAVQGEQYVGFTDLIEGADDGLINGLTGVLPQCRRRGIATMLKSAAIHLAVARGYRYIKTFNDGANVAILSLNLSLGFAQKSAWLHFEKTIEGR